MRRTLFLALTLILTLGAVATTPPPAEAATTCSWACGPCGAVCPCDRCKGPFPLCACI